MSGYLVMQALFWGIASVFSVHYLRGTVSDDKLVPGCYAAICALQFGLACAMFLAVH